MGKEKAPLDPVKRFADSLREKKGLTWATAKLEVQDDDAQYVDYFRGKDFARFLRADTERLSSLQAAVQVLSSKAGRTVDEQIGDVMQLLLKRKLIRKADRKYKRPKPGRKRLVKYPKTLVPLQESGWDEAAFYCWTYDRPTSVWYYVGTVALPVLVIAACLFPLAPWYVRMTLVYFLMALLTALLGLIALRYVLFAAVWIVTGHSFWLFPNLMSDEVSVLDALKPVVSYSRPGKDAKGQWLSRGATLLVVASVVYLLHGHTPDAKRLADRAKKAHDSILDYLDVYGQKSAGRLQGEGAGAGVPSEGHQGHAGGQGTGGQQQQYQRSSGGRGAGSGRAREDL